MPDDESPIDPDNPTKAEAGTDSEENPQDIDAFMEAIESSEPSSDHDEPIGESGHVDEALVEVPHSDIDEADTASDTTEDIDTILPEGPESVDIKSISGENAAAAGASEDTAGLPQEMLDELIAEGGGESAGTDSGESVSPTDVPLDLLEEIAAEAQSISRGATTATSSGPVRSDSGSATESVSKPRRDPAQSDGAFRALVRANPMRFAISALVGVMVFVVLLGALRANPTRPLDPDALSGTLTLSNLEQAVETARGLMSAGNYREATSILESALAAAAPSTLKSDAEFMRLEAMTMGIEPLLNPSIAEAMHRSIDRAVDDAPLHPKVPLAKLWKARVYLAEDNILAARSTLRKALEEHPDAESYDALLMSAGKLELDMDNPIGAAEHFQKIVDQYPDSILLDMARLHIGDAFRLAKNYNDARTIYVRLAQSQPGTDAGRIAFERLGEVAFETGDFTSAIRELESRLERATSVEGNDGVYLLLAKTHKAAGDAETSEILLNELIAFFPESDVIPLAHVELASIAQQRGELRDAVRIISRARDRYPGNPQLTRRAAELFVASERYQEAGDAFLEAYDVGTVDAALLLNAAKAYRQAELTDAALAALDRLEIEHPVSNAANEGAIVWADVMYVSGAIAAAIERLETIARVNRNPTIQRKALSALANAYEQAGFAADATNTRITLADATQDSALLAETAVKLISAKEWDAGLSVADRVDPTVLDPAPAYAFLVAKGTALLRTNTRQALDTLDDAYEQYPDQRTVDGDAALLRANLSTERSARARAIVSDMSNRYAQSQDDRAVFEDASNAWGDFLFNRRDYRAAAEAYRTTLGGDLFAESTGTASPPSNNREAWAAYQRANALSKLSVFRESLMLYEQVAKSSSPWADEAAQKSEAIRLQLRMRGEDLADAREAG